MHAKYMYEFYINNSICINFVKDKTETRHVLMGQIPPQQQPLGHEQQLCEVSSPSKLPVKDKGPEINFCHALTVTLTLGISP